MAIPPPASEFQKDQLARWSERFWGPQAGESLAKPLAIGALLCGVYAAAYVAVNGVFLDESVQPAQIISGAVQYPAGHPHGVFYSEAYSLGNYLSAAVVGLTQNVWIISALRNWLTLFCTTFLPFALTLLLTRSPAWGFVASALTLTEAAVAFQGVYPLWVFPATYSTGNTSLHLALLAVVLLLGGFWRLGGALVGLLPSIHPSLALLAWGWTALHLLVKRRSWRRNQLVSLGQFLGAGLVVCLALGLVVLLQIMRITAAGGPPYVPADVDGELVRNGYIALTDPHRRLFDWPSVAYVINPAAFAAMSGLLLWGAWLRRRAGRSSDGDGYVGWVVLVGALAWMVVYGAGLFQAKFGSLPNLIGTLMPYRLSNVTAVLLIPLIVSGIGLASASLGARRWLVWGAMGVLMLALGVWVDRDRQSVFRFGMYILLGAFPAVEVFAHGRDIRRSGASVGVLVAFGALTWKLGLRTQVIYVLMSFVATSALLWGAAFATRLRSSFVTPLRTAFLGLLTLGCVAAIFGASASRSIWDGASMVYDASHNPTQRWDALSPYDQALGEWLRANTAPDDMILSPVWPRTELQQKVGHPVLFELETLPNLTYLPIVSASTGILARDLYGVDYSRADQLSSVLTNGHLEFDNPIWLAAWRTRNRSEWHALSDKYAFHLVLAPSQVRLDLPVALPGQVWTLYTIP